MWGFPRIGLFWGGIPTIRIRAFGGTSGYPYFGKCPLYGACRARRLKATRQRSRQQLQDCLSRVVLGLGFRVWGLGFRVSGSTLGGACPMLPTSKIKGGDPRLQGDLLRPPSTTVLRLEPRCQALFARRSSRFPEKQETGSCVGFMVIVPSTFVLRHASSSMPKPQILNPKP